MKIQTTIRGLLGAGLCPFVLVLTSLTSVAGAQSARHIAQIVFPSTVLVVLEDRNGQPQSQGSGFFVSPDIVVTNFHVVEGAHAGFVKLIGKKATFEIAGAVAIDVDNDLALLKISGVQAPALSLAGGKKGVPTFDFNKFKPVTPNKSRGSPTFKFDKPSKIVEEAPLDLSGATMDDVGPVERQNGPPAVGAGDANPFRRNSTGERGASIAIGDTIYVAGNPLGLEGTFSQGIVSGIRHGKNGSLIQITAPISPGSSGGPVVDSAGQVVGVATGYFRGGQNLNFAVPSFYVRAALGRASAVRKLASLRKFRGSKRQPPRRRKGAVEGVRITHVMPNFPHYIEFSIRNLTRRPIKNVKLLFVLKDPNGEPVDVVNGNYRQPIPSRLAKRSWVKAENSSMRLAFPWDNKAQRRLGFYEVRVLSFEFAE